MNFQIAPKSTEVKLNWEDAKLYCSSLDLYSKTDWRLPTKEELNQIYESGNDFDKDWYWSSTENCGDYAWGQGFYSGIQHDADKVYGDGLVRAVRTFD